MQSRPSPIYHFFIFFSSRRVVHSAAGCDRVSKIRKAGEKKWGNIFKEWKNLAIEC